MYAHLETKRSTPVYVTGYRLNSKTTFGYGVITVDAECVFSENEPIGLVSLCLYREDNVTGLPEDGSHDAQEAEAAFIQKILPRNDIVYLLSLLGLHSPGDVYENRRRVRVETPRARKHKFYERVELLYSQRVDEAWLQSHGTLFGYSRVKK